MMMFTSVKEMRVIVALCATCVTLRHSLSTNLCTLSLLSFINLLLTVVCLLLSLSCWTGGLFLLFSLVRPPLFFPPPFISPQTLAFSPGSSGEGGNNYYVNKYACCNHIRATDPIRELIAGGWLRGLAADGQGLCVCLTDWPAEAALGRHISGRADWRNESRLVPHCMQSCTLNNALWPGPCPSAGLAVCRWGV